jgi:hypothetical protein
LTQFDNGWREERLGVEDLDDVPDIRLKPDSTVCRIPGGRFDDASGDCPASDRHTHARADRWHRQRWGNGVGQEVEKGNGDSDGDEWHQ